MVGNPTTLQRARQGGWNSNHLPYCLLCGCLIKKLQTLRFTCRPIQESDHLVVGEVSSPAQQMVISTNTFWFIPEKNCLRCTTTSPSILHKSAQSSEERQVQANWKKQILATIPLMCSHSAHLHRQSHRHCTLAHQRHLPIQLRPAVTNSFFRSFSSEMSALKFEGRIS